MYRLEDLRADFPDDDPCLRLLWRLRHDNDDTRAPCPRCGRVRRFHRVAARRSFACQHCGAHRSPTAGTVMSGSRLPLRVWFEVAFILASRGLDTTAVQIRAGLGGAASYKTARRLTGAVRGAIQSGDARFGADVATSLRPSVAPEAYTKAHFVDDLARLVPHEPA